MSSSVGIARPHEFRYLGTNIKKTRFVVLSGLKAKPVLYIYECKPCNSRYESPLFFTEHELNQAMTNKFPCLESLNH